MHFRYKTAAFIFYNALPETFLRKLPFMAFTS